MKNLIEVNFTRHSIERNTKRNHLHGKNRNKSQLRYYVEHAVTADRLREREMEWVLMRERDNCSVLVYKDLCLIVSPDNTVITVYKVPKWFNSTPSYHGKEVVRNTRSFIRNRDFEYCA